MPCALQVVDVTRLGDDVRLHDGRDGLMFTGIVEELGEVVAIEPLGDSVRLTVRGPTVTSDAAHGDSIAVNGCCLTVVDVDRDAFTADVMQESLDRTSLGAPRRRQPASTSSAPSPRRPGSAVIMVQGHVDGTGDDRAARAERALGRRHHLAPGRSRPLRRDEGLDRRRWRLADGERRSATAPRRRSASA